MDNAIVVHEGTVMQVRCFGSVSSIKHKDHVTFYEKIDAKTRRNLLYASQIKNSWDVT